MVVRRVFILAVFTQVLLIITAWAAARVLRLPPQWGEPGRDVAIGLAGALLLAAANYLLLVHGPAVWLVRGVRAVYHEVLIPLFSRFNAMSPSSAACV